MIDGLGSGCTEYGRIGAGSDGRGIRVWAGRVGPGHPSDSLQLFLLLQVSLPHPSYLVTYGVFRLLRSIELSVVLSTVLSTVLSILLYTIQYKSTVQYQNTLQDQDKNTVQEEASMNWRQRPPS